MFSQETLNQDFIKMAKGDVPPNKFYTLPKKGKTGDVQLVEPTQVQVAQAKAQIRKEETINRPAKRAKRSKPLKAFD